MTIKDRNVRESIDVIYSEFEAMEEMNVQLNTEIEALIVDNDFQRNEIEELNRYVKELEEALAQAVLTSIPPNV